MQKVDNEGQETRIQQRRQGGNNGGFNLTHHERTIVPKGRIRSMRKLARNLPSPLRHYVFTHRPRTRIGELIFSTRSDTQHLGKSSKSLWSLCPLVFNLIWLFPSEVSPKRFSTSTHNKTKNPKI